MSTLRPRVFTNATDNRPCHQGVRCQDCRQEPIYGVRYVCGYCENYNLCQICWQYTSHDATHLFVAVAKPRKDIPLTGPLLTFPACSSPSVSHSAMFGLPESPSSSSSSPFAKEENRTMRRFAPLNDAFHSNEMATESTAPFVFEFGQSFDTLPQPQRTGFSFTPKSTGFGGTQFTF